MTYIHLIKKLISRKNLCLTLYRTFCLSILLCLSGQLISQEKCWSIRDENDNNATLYSWDNTGSLTEVGKLNTESVETMTMNGDCNSVYTTSKGNFGSVNLTSGLFTVISDLGDMYNPTLGTENISDVDGMAIDNLSGYIYAVERKVPGDDLLFLIDPTNGSIVSNAFGPSTDYVPIPGALEDVDDIAFNPCTYELFGISTVSGSTTIYDRVVKIDINTGQATTLVSTLECDIEGLTFDNDCKLYGSVGYKGCVNPGAVFETNQTTGALTEIVDIGGDVEAVVCCVPAPLPSALTCNIDEIISDCSASGASLQVLPSGGTGGYTYSWSTGSTSNIISGLSVGAYSVKVEDFAGNTTTCNYTITECTAACCENLITNGGFENYPSSFTFPYTFEGLPANTVGQGNWFSTNWISASSDDNMLWLLKDNSNQVNNPEGSHFAFIRGQGDCAQLCGDGPDQCNIESLLCSSWKDGNTYELCFETASWDENFSGNTPTGPGTQTGSSVSVEVQYQTGISNISTTSLPASSSFNNLNWQQICATFSYDASNPIKTFFITQSGTGGIVVDDVIFTDFDDPCCEIIADIDNSCSILNTNHGFENSGGTNFSTNYNGIPAALLPRNSNIIPGFNADFGCTTNGPCPDSYWVNDAADNVNNPEGDKFVVLTQHNYCMRVTISLTEGECYDLSAYGALYNNGNITGELNIEYLDSNSNLVVISSNTFTSSSNFNSLNWSKFTTTFTPPSTGTFSLYFTFDNPTGAFSGGFALDDIRITPCCYEVCSGESVTLNGNSTGGTGSVNYSWSNGQNTQNITVTPTSNTSYTLTATDSKGCESNATIEVNVEECCEVDHDIPDSWDFSCDDNTKVELLGTGINNNLPATINIPNPGNVTSIIAQATFKENDNDCVDFITQTENASVSWIKLDDVGCPHGYSYRAMLDPSSYVTVSADMAANAQSFVIYVFRQDPSFANSLSQGRFINACVYQSSHCETFTLPTQASDRDIDVTIPISDLHANPDKVMYIHLDACGTSSTTTVNNYNSGNSLTMVDITLEDVAGTCTSLEICYESPADGQSFYMSGSASVESVCCDMTCSIVRDQYVDCDCGENGSATVNVVNGSAPYTYLWSNGETTQQASSLGEGSHTVIVTDSNNCETSCEIYMEVDPGCCFNIMSNGFLRNVSRGN